MNIHSISFRK